MLKKTFFLYTGFYFIMGYSYAQTLNRFILKGNITGIKDGSILYLTRDLGKDTVDRSISKEGRFIFRGSVSNGAEPYYIRLDTLLSKNTMAIVLVNKPMTVQGEMKSWPQVNVKGSDAQDDYLAFVKLFTELNTGLYSLENKVRDLSSPLSKAKKAGDSVEVKNLEREMSELNLQKEEAVKERKNETKTFIENHPNSLYIADVINRMEGSLFDLSEMEVLYDKLTARAQSSTFGIALKNRLKVGEVKEGKVVGDFSRQTPSGEKLSLKEVFSKGKYTLLDFWASWCVPCRVETPNIRKAYLLYKDKGFNVFSVTLDTNIEDWKKAIIKDTMPWYNVIDTQGQSAVSKSYNVTKIPTTFLIDSTGKIIATELRGDSLLSKLYQLLGKK